MKFNNLTRISFLLLFASLSVMSWSQVTYQISPENSRIWVDGTSTLKNWKAEVGTFEGTITTDESGKVASVSLSCDVKSMDGGRGPDMNAKIYKALKVEEYPKITFTGSEDPDDDGELDTAGTLDLAGVQKEVSVMASGTFADGKISGTYPLKFSDFNIKPPSAMFGTIVCHDDITINFELTLAEESH